MVDKREEGKPERKVRSSNEMNSLMMDALMEYITDGIYFKDLESRIIRVNKACAEKSYKFKSPEEAIGKTDFDFFSKEHAAQAFRDEQNIIKTGQPLINIEEKETWHGAEPRWISTTKMPFYDREGNIIGTFGVSRDITDRKKAEEKIEFLSFHDTLTGLYNRAFFEEELQRLDTGRQLPLTIVMGDVNGLKVINDAYGHAKGDEFLIKIADIMRDSFRKEDILSRWGGDEFIAILPKTISKDAQKVVKRIKDLCKKESTTEMPLSISLGISTKNKAEECVEEVIKRAESRMYKCKALESKSVNENLVESLKENLKKGEVRTEKSIRKVEEYAIMLGKKLNLSLTKLEELKLLINLHNIGKIALVDEIMSKKGRLTKEEWEIIKELPVIGYRIAESSEKLKTIAEPILTHHEWYDGKGYPRGIKGEEIPIISRISALVNAYDAMTSDRPYRKRLTKKQAMEEIKRCSGTQFDPKVADAFIEILKEED
jgi:diguanylate cyclase (GGDEF)-like protein/PAS domain S-box-containing protein